MSLDQPAWFADVDAWWVPAVGEEVAARVRPLGFDSEFRLHVECDGRAWTTQVRLLADRLAKRIDMCVPQHRVTGMIAHPYAVAVPGVLEERWQELVGEDLGTQILPLQLARQGPGTVDTGALCRGPRSLSSAGPGGARGDSAPPGPGLRPDENPRPLPLSGDRGGDRVRGLERSADHRKRAVRHLV